MLLYCVLNIHDTMSLLKQTFFDIRKKLYNISTYLGYKYNLKVYDQEFFNSNKDEGLKMASWFIPALKKVTGFNSIIDIGCGTGHYLRYCLDNGITDVFGLEGSPHAFESLLVDKNIVVMHDLRKPYTFSRKWDIAISIEVAEHVDKLYTNNYIKILTDSSNIVILTAAQPGQGGTAHVNEQTPEWWKEKFGKFGFTLDEEATNHLKNEIRNAKANGGYVTDWFEPNILIFKRKV